VSHLVNANKMVGDTPRTDTELEFDPTSVDEVLDWSRQLERELTAANERIPLLIAERDTARRQADQNWKLREEFTDLLGTDDLEQGVAVVREMKQRIKRLEEAGDLMVETTTTPAAEAWRKAKEAKPCIKQLKTKSCIYCMKVECECSDFDVSADMGAKG
jgi:L-ribulose-5-phosphate 3-epimerase UlaE